jgi:acetate kinase
MSAHVLTLNAGSSSLKFGLFAAREDVLVVATGLLERIGESPRLKAEGANGMVFERHLSPEAAADHASALQTVLGLLKSEFPDDDISAVGHRVVHGGPNYSHPVAITRNLLTELERFEPFAPLHQPHNLAGVRSALQAFPDAVQVACFDTAFHRQHPFVNDVFALPREYYDRGVRRYGFHGLSYEYVSGELSRIAPHLHSGRVVIAHLGNGASMCGLLDGLPMGTRCGQLDPGVLLYLMDQEGMDAAAISDLLYKRSGLLGLSGISNDMRTLEAATTSEAEDAIAYFVFRIRRELGALAAVLGGLDALVFCGGIGENSHLIRERVCEGMGWIGIELDRIHNEENATVISTDLSRARVMVIPTDEEVVIARAALDLMVGVERRAAE